MRALLIFRSDPYEGFDLANLAWAKGFRNVDVMLVRCECASRTGRHDLTLELAKDGIRIFGPDAGFEHLMANSYAHLRRFRDSDLHIRRALRSPRTSIISRQMHLLAAKKLAAQRMEEGRYVEALHSARIARGLPDKEMELDLREWLSLVALGNQQLAALLVDDHSKTETMDIARALAAGRDQGYEAFDAELRKTTKLNDEMFKSLVLWGSVADPATHPNLRRRAHALEMDSAEQNISLALALTCFRDFTKEDLDRASALCNRMIKDSDTFYHTRMKVVAVLTMSQINAGDYKAAHESLRKLRQMTREMAIAPELFARFEFAIEKERKLVLPMDRATRSRMFLWPMPLAQFLAIAEFKE